MRSTTGYVFVYAKTGEPAGKSITIFRKPPSPYMRESRARVGLTVVEVTVTELDRSLLDGSRKF